MLRFYHIVLMETALALLLGFILWQVVTRLRRGEAWIGGSPRQPAPAWPKPVLPVDVQQPVTLLRAPVKPEEPVESKPQAAEREPDSAPQGVSSEAEKKPRPAIKQKASAPQRRVRKPSALAGPRQVEPARDSIAKASDQVTYYSELESRLEKTFALFETGTITLGGFERILSAERDAAQIKYETILESSSRADDPEFQARCADIEQARIAIAWCANWAQDMRRKVA